MVSSGLLESLNPTLRQMGMPVGPLPALPTEAKTTMEEQTTVEEGNGTKSSYALAVSNPTSSCPKKNCHGSLDVKARYSIRNGIPAIIFKASDYYGVMAEECRYTIVGKFLRTRPQIEKIRSKFAKTVSIRGTVKIGVYDFRTVFIDCSNEED